MERSIGGVITWARHIKTQAPAVEGETATRSFTRSTWEGGKLLRYAVGQHALNTADGTAVVTGTGYHIRWEFESLLLVPTHVWQVEHTHRFNLDGSLSVVDSISKDKLEKGTFTGERSAIDWEAAAAKILVEFTGFYDRIDRPDVAAAQTILGDRSQRIERTVHFLDGSYLRTILDYTAAGSGEGTIKLYAADGTEIEASATLAWDATGAGTMTADTDPPLTFAIYVPCYLPPYLR